MKKQVLFCLALFLSGYSLNAQITSTSVYVSPHPDDWQLFMNPNAYNSIKNPNEKVIFIHPTSGNGNSNDSINYIPREKGSLDAVRFLTNIDLGIDVLGYDMHEEYVPINGHSIKKYSYGNAVMYFLRLPDGSPSGTGYPETGNESLQKFFNNEITIMKAIDGSEVYSGSEDLKNTLKAIVMQEAIGEIAFNMADPNYSTNPGDHSDHYYSAMFMQNVATDMNNEEGLEIKISYYQEYCTSEAPSNLEGNDLWINIATWGVTNFGMSDYGKACTWDNWHNSFLNKQIIRYTNTFKP